MRLPLSHGSRAAGRTGWTIDQVAFGVELAVDAGMDGCKLLQGLKLPEVQYETLSSPEQQVRVLGLVVEPAAHHMPVKITQIAHRGRVGFEPVGDDGLSPVVPLQGFLLEPECGSLVTFFW